MASATLQLNIVSETGMRSESTLRPAGTCPREPRAGPSRCALGLVRSGELRRSPLITATNVRPKKMGGTYGKAATAVLEHCLPI